MFLPPGDVPGDDGHVVGDAAEGAVANEDLAAAAAGGGGDEALLGHVSILQERKSFINPNNRKK